MSKAQHIHLTIGDLTTAAVDAIVNAANPGLLGGGGVDGAIHRAAGPQLLAACRNLPAQQGVRCPTGEARITAGFNLPAQQVIHTVGPVYSAEQHPAALLASAYRNSYRLALAHQCRSVALPAISCGVYGYPLREAAEIALAVSDEPAHRQLSISFYLFSADIYAVWAAAYAALTAD